MDEHSISLIIIVVCVILSAYFSATETAFSSLNRIRIKNMAENGNKRAKLVLDMTENYEQQQKEYSDLFGDDFTDFGNFNV